MNATINYGNRPYDFMGTILSCKRPMIEKWKQPSVCLRGVYSTFICHHIMDFQTLASWKILKQHVIPVVK